MAVRTTDETELATTTGHLAAPNPACPGGLWKGEAETHVLNYRSSGRAGGRLYRQQAQYASRLVPLLDRVDCDSQAQPFVGVSSASQAGATH